MLAALMATSLGAEVRTGNRFTVTAETTDGGGGARGSSRYSETGSVASTVTGASTSGTTNAVHGFISALQVAHISTYDSWALARGLTIGVNAGFLDDPNGDGIQNIQHFAFDSDPLGFGSGDRKRFPGTLEIGGQSYLTLTLPIRTGAVFAGSPLTSSSVNGVFYQVLGDTDLDEIWPLSVVEVIPALDAGLPPLSDLLPPAGPDWEYRTFRLTQAVGTTPRQFMRAGVSTQP